VWRRRTPRNNSITSRCYLDVIMYASQFPFASGETRYYNLMMKISERPGSVRGSTSNRDRNFRAKLVHVNTVGPENEY
jgi:hypothetical protein